MIIRSLTGPEIARGKIADQKPRILWSEHDHMPYAEIDVDGYKVLIDAAEFMALAAWFAPKRCQKNDPDLPLQRV